MLIGVRGHLAATFFGGHIRVVGSPSSPSSEVESERSSPDEMTIGVARLPGLGVDFVDGVAAGGGKPRILAFKSS